MLQFLTRVVASPTSLDFPDDKLAILPVQTTMVEYVTSRCDLDLKLKKSAKLRYARDMRVMGT
jgi:hypothetical protein